jgi:protease I
MTLQNKKILFILPHTDFRDKEYVWLKERFDAEGMISEVASSHLSEANGRFGTMVSPDVLISFVSSGDYDAFVFVGGMGAKEYYGNPEVIKLVINAITTHKLVAAIGLAVPILGDSGLLNSRKVTGPEYIRGTMEDAGAFFTSRLVEQDGDIITANGPYATRELAESIIKALEWANERKHTGRTYLR